MKLFFILYWTTFFTGWWAVRSYQKYDRYSARHGFAERHRQRLQRRVDRPESFGPMLLKSLSQPRPQLSLFEQPRA